jgi:TonB family protein
VRSSPRISAPLGGTSSDIDAHAELSPAFDDSADHFPDPSMRWKYASFFNRVKKQVFDQWKPEDVARRNDPTYGQGHRLTILRVHLDSNGVLLSASVDQTSGVPALDDAALAALRKAQPFPSPPRGLVNTDGEIRFRFGFGFDPQAAAQNKRDAGVADTNTATIQ